MEAMEEQARVTRLYVGGLGERVTEEDIKKTFCNLGIVQSVDIIRTKGRSFAYINFFPSSHNSLAKLFSTYNGCSWKGGKLKLEKAKEHYIDRLKSEWAEESEIKDSEHIKHGDVDVSIVEPQSTLVLKDMELRLFFPKLRKVKPLPLSGTGKHKYSFRRLEGPPHPVHICDCPEHSVPVQTRTVSHANASGIQKGGINKEKYNTMNSVMNRFPSREKDLGEAKIHDSELQDGGMNEEEINMMDSVMKKLLDKGTPSKNDRKNLNIISQEKTFPTSENQEETNNIANDDYEDDETNDDDDDIQINAVAVQNFSTFSSRLLDEETNVDDDDDDIQINAVGGRNNRRTSLANEIESLNRKRKSVSTETNANDLAYPIHEKTGHSKIQSKRSEPEPEPKKANTKGMWSQKSAWKQLVGDGSSSSFTLSQITPGDDTTHEERPKLENIASSHIKKSKKVRKVPPKTPTDSKEEEENNFVQTDQPTQRNKKSKKSRSVAPEEPEPSDETPTDSKENEEEVFNFVQTGQSAQCKMKSKKARKVGPEEPKPSNETPTANKEDKEVDNFVQTGQSAQHDEKDGPTEASRGSSWLQRSSWTQLVGGYNDSSFSISQILPRDVLQRQSSDKPDDFGTFSTISTGAFWKEQRTSEMGLDGSTSSTMKKDNQVASAPRDVEESNALETKKASSFSRRGVEISESCPFMRNADSVKDWMTAKTAMSNSLKKMKNK